MPTARPPRSAVTSPAVPRAAALRAAVARPAAARATAGAALLLALTGCSLLDRDSGPEDTGSPAPAASSALSATGSVSVSTLEDTCARALETARTAPERLREDPLGLLAEVDDLAATAPPELSGQITAVRDAVDEFRQGERSLLGVVREARALQERCSG